MNIWIYEYMNDNLPMKDIVIWITLSPFIQCIFRTIGIKIDLFRKFMTVVDLSRCDMNNMCFHH